MDSKLAQALKQIETQAATIEEKNKQIVSEKKLTKKLRGYIRYQDHVIRELDRVAPKTGQERAEENANRHFKEVTR